MLTPGARVATPYGPGTVESAGAGRVVVSLDMGGFLNVARGSSLSRRIHPLGPSGRG